MCLIHYSTPVRTYVKYIADGKYIVLEYIDKERGSHIVKQLSIWTLQSADHSLNQDSTSYSVCKLGQITKAL